MSASETITALQVAELRRQASAALRQAQQELNEARGRAAAASDAAALAKSEARDACKVRYPMSEMQQRAFRICSRPAVAPRLLLGMMLKPVVLAQAMQEQLCEEQQLRQQAEARCTAAEADAQAACDAAARDRASAKAAVKDAERRAAAAARTANEAATAAAVAAAQRQQAEQASDLFQQRLHEVQDQLRTLQQRERALQHEIAQVSMCFHGLTKTALTHISLVDPEVCNVHSFDAHEQ